MNKDDLKKFCENDVLTYQYEVPDSAVGNALPKEKIEHELKLIAPTIVDPYLEKMTLGDTYDQTFSDEPEYKELWVVSDDKEGCKVFYDPDEKEFGLAMYKDKETPQTIGVRGDFVGVFLAK